MTPIGPYLFHLYVGQDALLPVEMVAYNIGLDLLKYICTPKLDPDQPTPSRSDPRSSPPTHRNNWKSNHRPRLSQGQNIQGEETEFTQQEIDDMANSFSNAIRCIFVLVS